MKRKRLVSSDVDEGGRMFGRLGRGRGGWGGLQEDIKSGKEVKKD